MRGTGCYRKLCASLDYCPVGGDGFGCEHHTPCVALGVDKCVSAAEMNRALDSASTGGHASGRPRVSGGNTTVSRTCKQNGLPRNQVIED
jgi:hypothetical protein